MAGEAPERSESESIGKAVSQETPAGVKLQSGGGSASHVTPVAAGVKLQTGGGSAKYPSAPRKSDLAVTSSGNSRKTISAPRVNINSSDENASNGSDLDDGSRDLPKKKKKVQDGTEGIGGVGNRGLGGDGNEAVSASGDNSSKAVQKLTYSSAENQKGLGKRAKGKDVMGTTRLTKSKRAGLAMPVAKVLDGLKKGRYAPRVRVDAAVYLAASLEYCVAEVLELAGNCSKYMKRKRVTPHHIQMTFLHDAELGELTKGVIVPEGGVKPSIQKELLPPHLQMKTNDDAEDSEATQRAASTDVSIH